MIKGAYDLGSNGGNKFPSRVVELVDSIAKDLIRRNECV